MDTHAPASSMTGADEEQEEGEDLCAIDYARHYGLSTPFYDEQLLVGGLPTPPLDDFDQDPWDPSNALSTRATSVLIKERLTVNKDAALLLKAVHDFREVPQDETTPATPRQFARQLKQELPVLRTDNELDMLSFGNASAPDLTKLNIPSEMINNENDEGLEWPRKYLRYPAQCENQIKAEKLAVLSNALRYLQDAVCDSHVSEDFEKFKVESVGYTPNTTRRPVTPPLLPLSPVIEPYVPSSPANRLPLLSNSSDSVTTEAKALELQIMEADTLTRKNSDSSDSMLLDFTHPPPPSPLFEKRTATILKRRAEDYKVEGPLTPQTLPDSPMKKLKSVSFSTILHQFIPEAPWVTTRSDGEDDEDPDTNAFFEEAICGMEPSMKEAIARLANEKLSDADTTARVDVPHADFTLPVTPWNVYSQRMGGKHRPDDTELSAQMKFLLRVKREDLKTATSWHGASGLDRQLSWSIFTTRITKINLDEQLHGESEFEKVHNELTTGNIATSSTQVWKPDALRMLDAENDEEEIEAAEMEERRDMEALICKRKLEIEEEVVDLPRKRASPQPAVQAHVQPRRDVLGSHHWNTGPPRPHAAATIHSNIDRHPYQRPQEAHKAREKPAHTEVSVNDLMFGGFSATSALHKFMETRGRAAGDNSSKTAKASQPANDVHTRSSTILVVRSREPSLDQGGSLRQQGNGNKRNVSPPLLPTQLPLPDNLAPCSFIISAAFLQQRSFIKQIEQLYTAAEIVYRDYELPHSPSKEADILLSPSTGLVLTTLQQVKQRPLPGQTDRSPIKERTKALQLRFERLVVVVSEGLSREMEQLGSSRPDDPRDKEALSQLESFATQLEGEVVVMFVRGGEQALARAVVVEMAKFGLQHGSKDIGTKKPLAVETTWEMFLRRAGLNPFAAQIIVASLQNPVDVQLPPISSSPTSTSLPQVASVSGLCAFIIMSEQERIKRFQALMGGSRILKMVGKALDQVWMSAAHGFQT